MVAEEHVHPIHLDRDSRARLKDTKAKNMKAPYRHNMVYYLRSQIKRKEKGPNDAATV